MTGARSRPGSEGAEGRDRKAEHIDLALDRSMQLRRSYFERFRFWHRALPEIDAAEIDLSLEFLGKRVSAPLLISCMTGGTERATRINRNLARAAEAAGVPLGLGSQRKALEDPSQAASFMVRDLAPSVPLLANLGAVQLNYGFGLDECRRAVEMIAADALVFHLNPLQEALQPEGQCRFKDLARKMGDIAAALEVPVIVKEIGCGLSPQDAGLLRDHGLRILDTAGVGGTSWARIEARRADEVELGELFAGWGVPTPISIRELRRVGGLTIIGSGGVRNGVDAAKAMALGAHLVGVAQPFLVAAEVSVENVEGVIARFKQELAICMFCLGVRTVAELRQVPIVERSESL